MTITGLTVRYRRIQRTTTGSWESGEKLTEPQNGRTDHAPVSQLRSRGSQFEAHCSRDPISKITRAKCTGGVAQIVENLLCECEALSSNPSLTKQKKKERKVENSNDVLRTYWSLSLNYSDEMRNEWRINNFLSYATRNSIILFSQW
jgi:hypothetical protein